jgi:uncharacterized protein
MPQAQPSKMRSLDDTRRAAQEKMHMGFEQYHEPAAELTDEARTYARIITSLIEEAEAIDWYQQRMSVENDTEAVAIMESAQEEEFKHFGMDLEFLLRRTPKWRAALQKHRLQARRHRGINSCQI